MQKTTTSTAFIPFARPALGHEEERAVLEVLRSGWLTTGEKTRQFEREFAAFVGARHALALSSGTAALHLALEALEIPEGAQVVTSPYTFTATAEVIRYLGAHPRFVDIAPGGFNIDPGLVEQALSRGPSECKAIMPIHVGGLPCDMESLCEIAGHYGLPVVEDAAHAFPSRTRIGYAGTLGTAGAYSFYANKTITTGEGGMLVTDDDRIARRAGTMRLHGIDRDVWDRYRTKTTRSWEYDVVAAGFKYNATDIASAIGIEQLKKAPLLLERRRRVAELYKASFDGLDFLELPPDGEGNAWHLYVIRLVPERLTIDRDEFIEHLAEAGIGTSVHYKPLHMMRYYRQLYGFSPEDFPNAYHTFQRAVSLPIYPTMSDADVERVVSSVLEIGTTNRIRLTL